MYSKFSAILRGENLDIIIAQYRSKKPSWLASAIDEMIRVSSKHVCPDVHEGIYLQPSTKNREVCYRICHSRKQVERSKSPHNVTPSVGLASLSHGVYHIRWSRTSMMFFGVLQAPSLGLLCFRGRRTTRWSQLALFDDVHMTAGQRRSRRVGRIVFLSLADIGAFCNNVMWFLFS